MEDPEDSDEAIPALSVEAFAAWRRGGRDYTLIDVREGWEVALANLEEARHIPLATLPASLANLPTHPPFVLLCHHGLRSAHAAQLLRAYGYAPVFNLSGGIDAYARRIDPSLAVY